jgi:hypothetical protein
MVRGEVVPLPVDDPEISSLSAILLDDENVKNQGDMVQALETIFI